MRYSLIAVLQLTMLLIPSIGSAEKLTPKQQEPWRVLGEQVSLDVKRDFKAMKKFIHPRVNLWGSDRPHPISMKSYAYYGTLRAGEDKIIAHHMVPVSVVVVNDVAIINAYVFVLTKPKDGKQVEKTFRLHNTWKKENGKWLLLATYNTQVKKKAADE